MLVAFFPMTFSFLPLPALERSKVSSWSAFDIAIITHPIPYLHHVVVPFAILHSFFYIAFRNGYLLFYHHALPTIPRVFTPYTLCSLIMTNPSIAMCFFMTILPQSCQYGGYSAHSIRARNFYLFTQIAQLFSSDFFNLSA